MGDLKYVDGGVINTVLLFIEPTEMTVQLIEGDYENADLQGSDIQEEYKVFLKEKYEAELRWEAITKEYQKLLTIYNLFHLKF